MNEKYIFRLDYKSDIKICQSTSDIFDVAFKIQSQNVLFIHSFTDTSLAPETTQNIWKINTNTQTHHNTV